MKETALPRPQEGFRTWGRVGLGAFVEYWNRLLLQTSMLQLVIRLCGEMKTDAYRFVPQCTLRILLKQTKAPQKAVMVLCVASASKKHVYIYVVP